MCKLSTVLTYNTQSKDDAFFKIIPCKEFDKIYSIDIIGETLPKILKKRISKKERRKETEEIWSFDINHYNNFITCIKKINENETLLTQCLIGAKEDFKEEKNCPKIEVEPLPIWVMKTLEIITGSSTSTSKTKIEVDEKVKVNHQEGPLTFIINKIGKPLWDKLFWYQKTCLKRAISLDGRLAIWDDTGIGKTIQALSIAKYYQESWPCLIVCTSKCKSNWVKEIKMHLGIDSEEEIQLIDGEKSLNDGKPLTEVQMKRREETLCKSVDEGIVPFSRCKLEEPSFVIMSYALVDPLLKVLTSYKYKMIIVDESSGMKNYDSKRTQALVEIIKLSKYALLLSATFATKSKEIWPSAHALRPTLFPYFQPFGERYCEPKQQEIYVSGGKKKLITTYDGCTNRNEQHIVLSTLIMIRRRKKFVGLQLPPKERVKFLLNPNKKQMKLVSKHMEKVDEKDIKLLMEKKDAFGKQNAFMQAYRKIAVIKRPLTQDYLTNHLPSALALGLGLGGNTPYVEKVLIFAHHRTTMDAAEEVLENLRIGFVRLDGKSKNKDCGEIVDTFQNNPECRVALLSITAAGKGLTLTAARNVIFLELVPNAEYMFQSEDRAWRIGQKYKVNVTYVIFPGSIEETIFAMINNKLKNLTAIGDGYESYFSAKKIKEKSDNNYSDDSDGDDSENGDDNGEENSTWLNFRKN